MILANKEQSSEVKDEGKVLRKERYWGQIQRSVTLASPIDSARAVCDNGVLVLTCRKSGQQRPAAADRVGHAKVLTRPAPPALACRAPPRNQESIMSDEARDRVRQALAFEPSIDDLHIDVTVENGRGHAQRLCRNPRRSWPPSIPCSARACAASPRKSRCGRLRPSSRPTTRSPRAR